MKIYMIDDELMVIKAIQRSLMLFDVHVDYSMNAKEAIPVVESGAYPFVILDYYMPEYSGEWFMKHVDLPGSTKVFLLSGYTPRSTVARMKDLGVSDCWMKPVTGQQILERLGMMPELIME